MSDRQAPTVTERALEDYLRHPETTPTESSLAHSALGEAAERRGDLTAATEQYELAARALPYPKPLLRLARVHFKRREWQACLDAYGRAFTATPTPGSSPRVILSADDGPENLEEAMVCAVAALCELGHVDASRANCPTLRRIFPGDPGVEALCRAVEAPWKSSADPGGCGRVCFSAAWRAPWENTMLPRPRPGCTRRHDPACSSSVLYESRPASFTSRPRGPHPLVVMTAPRPTPSLPMTLASLREAGADHWPWPLLLVPDGPLLVSWKTRDELAQYGWVERPGGEHAGSARTFVRALEAALEEAPDLELLTLVEDDVELCRNALDYVKRMEVPTDLALVTWFTYEFPGEAKLHEKAQEAGWRHPYSYGVPVLARRSTRHFLLAQCVTLTRDTVDRILRCPRARDWPQENGHDEVPAWALGDVPYAAHFPVLAQHAGGLVSAVAANRRVAPAGRDPQEGARTSPYYVGREFDALGLLPRNFAP